MREKPSAFRQQTNMMYQDWNMWEDQLHMRDESNAYQKLQYLSNVMDNHRPVLCFKKSLISIPSQKNDMQNGIFVMIIYLHSALSQYCRNSCKYYLNIQPHRPILHIIQLHLLPFSILICCTVACVCLPIACQSRLD